MTCFSLEELLSSNYFHRDKRALVSDPEVGLRYEGRDEGALISLWTDVLSLSPTRYRFRPNVPFGKRATTSFATSQFATSAL